MTEVSKILEYQHNHYIFGLMPTVCQDRFDLLEDLHHRDENNLTEFDDESYIPDDITGLDEIAALLSRSYEDIRASNPDIWAHEKQIDEIITRVIKRKSYHAFEQLMSPLVGLQGIDKQIDTLLLAARFVPFVPKIAANIQYWVTNNFNVSTKQLQNYNARLIGNSLE